MPQSFSYDHPSYLARGIIDITTTAGAAGTSGVCSFPFDVKIRNASVTVRAAGTSATTGNKADFFSGTSSIGTVANGTSAANTVGTSGDMNTTIAAGTLFFVKNGTDATGTCNAKVEYHIAPLATVA